MPSFDSGTSISALSFKYWGARGGILPPRPEGAAATARIIGSSTQDQAPPKA